MKTWPKFTSFTADRRRRLLRAGQEAVAERLPALTIVASVLVLALMVLYNLDRMRPVPESPRVEQRAPRGPSGSSVAGHGGVIVRTDASSRVVQVRGPDPRAVLVAYCNASDPDRRAIELAALNPFETGIQLGLFWHRDVMYAVQIRRDPGSQQWIVGDGENPVAPRPADQLRLTGPRVDIRSARAG